MDILDDDLLEKNPFELFSYYYTDEVNTIIVEETNRYAAQKNNHIYSK